MLSHAHFRFPIDFLPRELIAQQPLAGRDDSRMMVVQRKEGRILHSRFKDFPFFFERGDVLVLNNTRVLPARVWGQCEGKEIEFLLLGEKDRGTWEVLCRPAKRVGVGSEISFSGDQVGRVIGQGTEGKRLISFLKPGVRKWLEKAGFPPLPPYIKRTRQDRAWRSRDLERYQTVFARKEGAIAAPTAGLHFTPRILGEIRKKGIENHFVSLRVGLATFQPVRVERVEDHAMLEETYSIGRTAAESINEAKRQMRPVTAVGTTVVRTLESAWAQGEIRSGTRATSLFIYPGYEFRVVDRLLTNFHLPRSTLLMMVAAFAGTGLIKKAYEEAVREKYRFYSYGDCMLIV